MRKLKALIGQDQPRTGSEALSGGSHQDKSGEYRAKSEEDFDWRRERETQKVKSENVEQQDRLQEGNPQETKRLLLPIRLVRARRGAMHVRKPVICEDTLGHPRLPPRQLLRLPRQRL
jgi:hypothetical protein